MKKRTAAKEKWLRPAVRAFGAEARLHQKAQLESIKRFGRSMAGRYSVVAVWQTPPDGKRRAAFLISRRFDLHAVVRNRTRRLYREAFRLLFPELPPCWIAFIPRKAIKNAKEPQVEAEVRELLTRLGVKWQKPDAPDIPGIPDIPDAPDIPDTFQ